MPHLYSVRTSLPLAQKFCSFFSIPALLVVLAAGSRIAVCPAASTFVFPTCQRTNYKSTRGGLLARRIALPELKPCAADVIETSLGGRTPGGMPGYSHEPHGKTNLIKLLIQILFDNRSLNPAALTSGRGDESRNLLYDYCGTAVP